VNEKTRSRAPNGIGSYTKTISKRKSSSIQCEYGAGMPTDAHDDLEFDFDPCSLMLTGDVVATAATLQPITSGTGDKQGTLSFSIGMDDGRSLTTSDDVVMDGLDLIQVLPNAGRLVGGKPSVGLVTVTNNTKQDQTPLVHFHVTENTSTVVFDQVKAFPASLKPGETRSLYFAEEAPIVPTDAVCKPLELQATASFVPGSIVQSPGDPKTACWLLNDSTGVKHFPVSSPLKPSLLWIRTGRIIDAASLASMTQVHTLHDLAFSFIRGVYPVADFDDSVSTFPLIPPISGVVLDLFATLLDGIGIPADAAVPYAMVAELDAAAVLSNNERMVGVLPSEWFSSFLYGTQTSTTGLSLTTTLPHAVIVEAAMKVDPNSNADAKPILMQPAHELGHTYGLSVDPSIKNWTCSVSNLLCGASGGMDEYSNPAHVDGIPTWGFWVPQGPTITPTITGEQCNSRCMMGASQNDEQNDWPNKHHWIDSADYDQLFDQLNRCAVPVGTTARTHTLYISGLIDGSDQVALGYTLSRPNETRRVDFPVASGTQRSEYGIVMLDASGKAVSEGQLPLNWVLPEQHLPLPATIFGGSVDFPVGTRTIQIWNRASKKLLAERKVSARAPTVAISSLKTRLDGRTTYLDASWSAADADADKMQYFVQMSADAGRHWWPVGHALSKPTLSVSLADAKRGTYIVRVLASDGVNVTSADASVTY
jgi:hypothetical protein